MKKESLPHELSAYAGRWVAILRGKVVAQGTTREEVMDAARLLRRKEIPEIRFVPDFLPILNSPLFQKIRDSLPTGLPVYLVGGAIRDSLLGRPTHDLDFVVPSGGVQLAKKIANALAAAFFPLDLENDTARVLLTKPDGTREVLDFAGLRGPSLDADLKARDFTVNAIALDAHTGEILDPLSGATDLRTKTIRACAPTAFIDDPLRILRAVRQAASLAFSIESQTRRWMKAAIPGLEDISPERQRDELFKILSGPNPDASMRALERLGVFPILLPELVALKGVEQSPPHAYEVWTHTLAVLRHLEGMLQVLAPEYDAEKAADLFNSLLVLHLGRYRAQLAEHLGPRLNTERSVRALLFFAALYHDIAKPQAKTIQNGRIRFLGHDEQGALVAVKRGMALHLSNDELDRLKAIVRFHMRIHFYTNRLVAQQKHITRKALYRFFRDVGPAAPDLVLLSLADLRGTYEQTLNQETWNAALETCRTLLEAWYERPEEAVHPPSLLNGDDLIATFGLRPGRQVGRLLEAIREEQAAGTVSTRAEALTFARRWIDKEEQ